MKYTIKHLRSEINNMKTIMKAKYIGETGKSFDQFKKNKVYKLAVENSGPFDRIFGNYQFYVMSPENDPDKYIFFRKSYHNVHEFLSDWKDMTVLEQIPWF